ncbi:helix-turn-helix domain-containing protein [Thiospirochaeta perfilievii]|uniref:Helix-turn-helix domain-containing protein n=1 Tax=Thiospirochaeta perfilievii TaxID=252967 RepID=A0A5C1QIA2_9SPIO|nr:helix-turn-helix domain-containing protein [Thiospirochaeta perfilievii]QEN06264.1 helix-turn-helix domain-containing protein [Thiospirochaeta perfilievii]
MNTVSNLRPFINIGPGYTIKKYLESRGWNQEDLAQIIDISPKQLSKIINDKAHITIKVAKLLADAFSTSAEFWVNLDTQYRLKLEPITDKETATQIKAKIRKFMPVSEIRKKGWFSIDNTASGYESLYENIWDKKPNDISIYENCEKKYCARQSKTNEEFTNYYSTTWQRIALLKAKTINVPKYNKDKLHKIIKNYTSYTVSTNGINEIIADLNQAGIKFLVLSHLTKTYLDGACFYDEENPVIVYTCRYDRIDNFWFTLAHEIAHVIKHLSNFKDKYFLDDLTNNDSNDQLEKEADEKAEELLRVEEIITESLQYTKYFSEEKLNIISKKLKIEQSVILGILQHKGYVDYRKLNKYKKKVKDKFPSEINFG